MCFSIHIELLCHQIIQTHWRIEGTEISFFPHFTKKIKSFFEIYLHKVEKKLFDLLNAFLVNFDSIIFNTFNNFTAAKGGTMRAFTDAAHMQQITKAIVQ